METLSAAQQRLGAAGFTDDLVAEGSQLRASPSGELYDPAELAVLEVVRFEGVSDPDEQAVLFAVATASGEPVGVYTTPYGPMAGPEDASMIWRLSASSTVLDR